MVTKMNAYSSEFWLLLLRQDIESVVWYGFLVTLVSSVLSNE